MRKLFLPLTIALGLVAAPAWAADEADVEHYEKRVKQINAAAEKPGMMKIAMQRISTETGVPVENVRGQHKRHPEVGAAGLLIANVLAAETKKTPEHFLNQRKTGAKWYTMMKNNKVPLEKINERMDHLERDLDPDKKRK